MNLPELPGLDDIEPGIQGLWQQVILQSFRDAASLVKHGEEFPELKRRKVNKGELEDFFFGESCGLKELLGSLEYQLNVGKIRHRARQILINAPVSANYQLELNLEESSRG